MALVDYDYALPGRLIAQEPALERQSSRLLVVKPDCYEHKRFKDIADYLRKDDVLVINESRVIPAMLAGTKSTGGKVTVILTGKVGDCHTAVCTRRVKVGMRLFFGDLKADILEKDGAFVVLRFSRLLTRPVLAKFCQVPVPPYVRLPLKDESRYQTVYGKKCGSIAAHTAGLHFTEGLLEQISKNGVKIARLCLHISYATFFPVRGSLENHRMHPEYCGIDKKNADMINTRKGRLIVVGTTVVKTLEAFADENGVIHPGRKESSLFIYPPYRFKVKIDALITNFHLPKSTLILLVSAYYGREKILKAYQEAIENDYMFYSFGDAMLLLKEYSQPQ
jgi:S-adenosylmethionine:tRNA ribosyltransferase-isomerase